MLLYPREILLDIAGCLVPFQTSLVYIRRPEDLRFIKALDT
jgi:hypothetical protein